jgi:colicin import membrane protein
VLDIPTIDDIKPSDVFGEAGADAILTKIETAAKAVEIDISTDNGRKECASVAYKIAKLKNGIDELGKGVASEWKAKAAKVDAARRTIWTKLEKLQTDIRQPLTDFETAEQTRVQDHEQRIALIGTLHTFEGFQPTAQDLQNRLAAISEHMQRDWQEFGKRATEVADATRDSLQKQLTARQKYDADQAELERLRKQQEERDRADREAKIKADAEAAAAKKAEQAIADARAREDAALAAAKDAEAKVERERKEGHERALASVNGMISDACSPFNGSDMIRKITDILNAMDEHNRNWQEYSGQYNQLVTEGRSKIAERLKEVIGHEEERRQKADQEREAQLKRDQDAAVEAERLRAAKAKADEEAAAAEREADHKHKAKINREALAAISIAAGISEEAAKPIVEAIARGAIPHITISY